MPNAGEALAGERDARVGERAERQTTALLLATDACCHAGHDIANVERGGGEIPSLVCVTCTALWGRREGLQSWQEHCSTCFAEVYPQGLPDLGVTAQPLSERQ